MRRLLPLVLLAHSMLFLLPGGVSLCVHSDGSWNLESAAFPCCVGGQPGEGHSPHDGPGADRAGCEDCDDYPLPSLEDAAATRSPERTGSVGVAPVAVAAPVEVSVLPWLVPTGARYGPAPGPPRTRAPSSTVFRC